MNKQQFIELIAERFPDNCIFDEPELSVTRPCEPSSYKECGHDHDGFAVMKPVSNSYTGEMSIKFIVQN